MYVFEEFVVIILIRSDGNGLCIFLDSCFNDVLNGVVVVEVDNFGIVVLYNLVYDIDGGVVVIEKVGGCYDMNFMLWMVGSYLLYFYDFG